MSYQPITANDIAGWNSLEDISSSFEKRGLKPRPNLGGENEHVLQIDDDEFVVLVHAGPGESATEFKPENRSRHTNLVATNDFEEFTFITRIRSWAGQQHGRIKHQKLSFTKSQFQRESGEKNTILQKLNSIEYGSSAEIFDTLYDTKQIVKEFYQQFEDLRTDLVQEVAGIPDDRGDAKQRYVQVIMDRMIFLYFIQEKRLLARDTEYLHDQPGKVVDDGDDRYEEFYKPLFFEYLAKDTQNPDFGKLPYLNGGLFAKNPVEEEFEDAKLGDSPERTNELFDKILDFLSDWNWNVDERLDIVDPKNLSPAVLGHIFEQTVNQKEMGAYYTPEEITEFMARRTIYPYVLEQLNEAIGADYEDIDEVFGFDAVSASSGETAAVADGGTVTQQAGTENVNTEHVETLYHDILKDIKVLDPAVGSGAFLLAAQEVLLDLYMQSIEYFQELEQSGMGWDLGAGTREELEEITSGTGNESLYAKRSIILNNLYGVDIDDGAVEIAKLRLWLSMVADIEDEPGEVEPLPNIDFNIRQGNSLIGFTDVINADADGKTSATSWNIYSQQQDLIEAIKKHRKAESAEQATKYRKIAEDLIDEQRSDFDEELLLEFKDAGIELQDQAELDSYSPLYWPLEFAEVWENGRFDIVIGNPPWEVLASNREDYFTKYVPEFRTLPDSEKDSKQEELLEDEEIAEGWEQHKERMRTLSSLITNGSLFNLQSPDVGGQGRHDLSALFTERVFSLASDEAYVAQIIPNKIFIGTSTADIRRHLLSDTTIQDIVTFENKGIFQDIDNRYKFGILTFRNGGTTSELNGKFLQHGIDILQNLDQETFEIPRHVLEDFSPVVGMFPQIQEQEEVDLLDKLVRHPAISNEEVSGWYIDIHNEELNRTRDSDRFVEDDSKGDYPVYGGGNFWQFEHDDTLTSNLSPPTLWSVDEDSDPDKSAKRRIREKDFRRLKRQIYHSLDGTGTQKDFVNSELEKHGRDDLSLDDVLLDCERYRLVFRDIANATNERSLITTVLPPGIVCHNKAPVIRPHRIDPSEEHLGDTPLHSVFKRIFTDDELFAALGLLNSISFDYLVRTKLDTSMSVYVLEESQMPRLTDGDDWFNFISKRAARLNCYGESFEEMRQRLGDISPVTDRAERNELQAEIDAAAFHAYGLEQEDVHYVLDDFHQVQNPRIMTDKYLELVLEKYKELEREGPLP